VCSLATLLLAAGGCSTTEYATAVVQQDTTYGRLNEAVMGSSAQLLQRGDIVDAKRYTTADGLELDVWVMGHAKDAAARGTVIMVHGLGDSKITYMRLGRAMAARGFDVVLPDMRAHGRSTGKYVTYGAHEKDDLKLIADDLLARKVIAEPLYVLGASVGGLEAIQYAALDPRIKGVIALAPPKDFHTMVEIVMRTNAPFMSPADIDKVAARAGEIAGFNPAEVSAITAVAKLKCPLLLIHGQVDTSIPIANSQAIYAAAPGPKELDTIPFAGHIGVLYLPDDQILKNLLRLADGKVGGATTQPAP
jgi:pimeloyl-ACP methyl ester carboxylesterase